MKKFFYLLLLCLCIAPATTSGSCRVSSTFTWYLNPGGCCCRQYSALWALPGHCLTRRNTKKRLTGNRYNPWSKKTGRMGLPRKNNPGDIDWKGSRICQSCAAGNPAKLFCAIFFVRRIHKREASCDPCGRYLSACPYYQPFTSDRPLNPRPPSRFQQNHIMKQAPQGASESSIHCYSQTPLRSFYYFLPADRMTAPLSRSCFFGCCKSNFYWYIYLFIFPHVMIIGKNMPADQPQ